MFVFDINARGGRETIEPLPGFESCRSIKTVASPPRKLIDDNISSPIL